jgi:hypothetical protein
MGSGIGQGRRPVVRLLRFVYGVYLRALFALLLPLLLGTYLALSTGREYGVGFWAELG